MSAAHLRDTEAILREIVKALAVTMADVQALKALWAVHQSDGRQQLIDSLSVAMRQYQPFLDSLDQASDETLIEWLKGTTGPVH